MEKVLTLEEARGRQREFAYASDYADYASDYGYGYGYGYGYASGYDVWFTKVANIGVDVLTSLKSPGCQWLYLCDEPTVQAQDEPEQKEK
jgi:hypothetical protein